MPTILRGLPVLPSSNSNSQGLLADAGEFGRFNLRQTQFPPAFFLLVQLKSYLSSSPDDTAKTVFDNPEKGVF